MTDFHSKYSCINKWHSFPSTFISCNYVASYFDFYIICTFNTKVLANSFTIDSCIDTRLVFEIYLIYTDLQDVRHLDCLILSNTVLCSFLLVFWLVTLAFIFPAIYLVLGLICVCIFKSSVLVFFVEILHFIFYLVNYECGAYLSVDHKCLYYFSV